jgi:hypothetical protein
MTVGEDMCMHVLEVEPILGSNCAEIFLVYFTQHSLANRSSYLPKNINAGNRNTPGVIGVSETATAVDTVNTEGTIGNNLFKNKLDVLYKKVSYNDTTC